MNIREFSQELLKVYDELSKNFDQYQADSGLHCLEGCGHCCNHPNVEASVLEMIPLALRIFEEKGAEEWLEKLEDSELRHCVMYLPQSKDGSSGKCTAYRERPSHCRMFGISGAYNKHHKITLSVCKLIRDKYPELTKIQEGEVSEENTPTQMTWSYKLAGLNPALIQNRMTINQALKQALEKVALYALYQEHH